jgi:hypothetical protein
MRIVCRAPLLVVALAATLVVIATLVGCSPAEPELPEPETPPVAETEEAETAPAEAQETAEPEEVVFTVTCPVLTAGNAIPVQYCLPGVSGGQNISLPLEWSGAPPETSSFTVAMVDRHPVANDWVHWILVDLPPDAAGLAEGASRKTLPGSARELLNTSGSVGYIGPQPPVGSGDHEYEITVYALDVVSLDIGDRPSAADIEAAVAGHALASATVIGVFGR